MIPPEPDPPEPVIPEYTYATSQPITLGSVTGTLYTDIQYNGSACKLTCLDSDHDTLVLPHIILYEVDGTKYCYFVYTVTTNYYVGVLGNNAEIGLTVPSYIIYNGTVTQSDSISVESSTPSDYFENVRTSNFTLVQRS